MIASPILRSCAGENPTCDESPRSGSAGDRRTVDAGAAQRGVARREVRARLGCGRHRASTVRQGSAAPTPARRQLAAAWASGLVASAIASSDGDALPRAAARGATRRRCGQRQRRSGRAFVGAKMPAAPSSSTDKRSRGARAVTAKDGGRRGCGRLGRLPASSAGARRRSAAPILPTSTPAGRRTWSTSADKDVTQRVARAGGRIVMQPATLALIRSGDGARRATCCWRRAHRGDRGRQADGRSHSRCAIRCR